MCTYPRLLTINQVFTIVHLFFFFLEYYSLRLLLSTYWYLLLFCTIYKSQSPENIFLLSRVFTSILCFVLCGIGKHFLVKLLIFCISCKYYSSKFKSQLMYMLCRNDSRPKALEIYFLGQV